MPLCFKKTRAFRSTTTALFLLKFVNLLMRAGRREPIIRAVIGAARLLSTQTPKSWMASYANLTHAVYTFKNARSMLTSGTAPREAGFLRFYNNFILGSFYKITPIFGYFIYKVDKNIRKFSRGKSGKYVFVWKYIAPYKRLFLVMRWATKDIRFQQEKRFAKRLEKTVELLNLNLSASFVWKSKRFAHNHVFKNLRKSLMSSLRTTSK